MEEHWYHGLYVRDNTHTNSRPSHRLRDTRFYVGAGRFTTFGGLGKSESVLDVFHNVMPLIFSFFPSRRFVATDRISSFCLSHSLSLSLRLSPSLQVLSPQSYVSFRFNFGLVRERKLDQRRRRFFFVLFAKAFYARKSVKKDTFLLLPRTY